MPTTLHKKIFGRAFEIILFLQKSPMRILFHRTWSNRYGGEWFLYLKPFHSQSYHGSNNIPTL